MSERMSKDKEKGLVRYNLALPKEEYESLRLVAKRRGRTVLSLIRSFTEAGLIVDESLENGGKLIRKDKDKETEIIII